MMRLFRWIKAEIRLWSKVKIIIKKRAKIKWTLQKKREKQQKKKQKQRKQQKTIWKNFQVDDLKSGLFVFRLLYQSDVHRLNRDPFFSMLQQTMYNRVAITYKSKWREQNIQNSVNKVDKKYFCSCSLPLLWRFQTG